MVDDRQPAFVFDKVLFFGRNLSEYLQMFNLEPSDWQGLNILDCPSGPASFVAQANRLGLSVTGCDPAYQEDLRNLVFLIEADIKSCLDKQASAAHAFDRGGGQNTAAYREAKLAAFREFANDYRQGWAEHRYIKAALPMLPFADGQFDLALSSNFLFLYSSLQTGGALYDSPFDYNFHWQAVMELYRLARETRIYPLKGPNAEQHQYLDKMIIDLKAAGISYEVLPVAYKDIEGANHMLRIWR